MKLQGHKTKMIRIRADQLKVHPEAQRSVVPSNLKRIIANFNLDATGVFAAVQYPINGDTGPWIIDGQHRLAALMHHGFGEWICDVKIYLDIQDHAAACELFLLLNKGAVVRPFDTYLNELKAGNPIAVGATAILKKHGIRIDAYQSDGTVRSIAWIKDLFAVDQGKSLDATMGLILAAWGSRSAALEGAVIKGIGHAISRRGGLIDPAVMTKKLSKYPGGPSGLVGDAKGLRSHRKTTTERCIAELVIETYNSGRRAGRLDPL